MSSSGVCVELVCLFESQYTLYFGLNQYCPHGLTLEYDRFVVWCSLQGGFVPKGKARIATDNRCSAAISCRMVLPKCWQVRFQLHS